MGEHRRSVTPYLGLSEAATSIGYYFSQPGHKLHHMKFLATEEVKSQDPCTTLARESMHIRLTPYGRYVR